MSLFADIILGMSSFNLEKEFQYLVPKELETKVQIGAKVEIPFGNKNLFGYVISISNKAKIEESKIKPIKKVILDENKKMIEVANFIKNYYGGSFGQVLKTIIPIKKTENKEIRTIVLSKNLDKVKDFYEISKKKNATARIRLLDFLNEKNEVDYTFATKNLKVVKKTIDDMVEKGVIELVSTRKYRNPIIKKTNENHLIKLNEEQKNLVKEIKNSIEKNEKTPYLIYGVTGSGKTVCYMEIIESVIAANKQVIVLIPEIALTYQTVGRFYTRFGDKVSIINSKMSSGERYDQYLRAKRGEVSIMIGPRSALFTPFSNLGLVVIDEEHDSSYKSETTPCYDAIVVAEYIAKINDALLVLGSATPSIKSFYKTKIGDYKLITLKNRVNKELPEVFIEDMKEELRKGNKTIFSVSLYNAIKTALEKNEQVIIFLNKRGYSGFISCRSCGETIKCPHCDISLTLHKDGNLNCHYCGYTKPMVNVCEKCGSKHIAGFRIGTQQVEEIIKSYFKEAKILRMDKDTTTRKNSHNEILEAFANKEADILIGTQMIVKGHDFPYVTVVAAIAADMSLFVDEYNANEVTFSLLTQAVGRAGRGKLKGRAYIQTYNPENTTLILSKNQDYVRFFEEEIKYREFLSYPPIFNMMKVEFSSLSEDLLEKALDYVINDEEFVKLLSYDEVYLVGPSKENVYKLEDKYRKSLYLRSKNDDLITKIRKKIEEISKENIVFEKVYVKYNRMS